MNPTIPILGSILVAGLAGSTHCAGMCGAFVTLVVSSPDARPVKPAALQLAYHLGRLATYTILGAVAGAVGSTLDASATLVGVQNLAITLSAAIVALFAIIKLLSYRGIRLPHRAPPAAWTALVEHLHRTAWLLSPVPRAAAIGMLTTLLPCGLLYAIVAAAMGTGSVLGAAAVMAAFWIGTVPLLATVGMGARLITGRPSRYLPIATTVLLLAMSIATLIGRGRILGLELPSPKGAVADLGPTCHPLP